MSEFNNIKFCRFCGQEIPGDAVICTHCGRQVEVLNTGAQQVQPNIVINNANSNINQAGHGGQPKNKVVALLLCIFLGWLGVHKFYEGKVGMGLLYFFTVGLFGIGVVVDFFVLLFKPNTYYV